MRKKYRNDPSIAAKSKMLGKEVKKKKKFSENNFILESCL
jgi:hypothetical protein